MREGRIGLVDVRDIAAVAVAALTEDGHTGETYIVTGPEALSFVDIAAKLSRAIGKPVSYVDVPPDAARQSMLSLGMPAWFVEDLILLYEAFSAGHGELVTDVVATVTKKQPISFDQVGCSKPASAAWTLPQCEDAGARRLSPTRYA